MGDDRDCGKPLLSIYNSYKSTLMDTKNDHITYTVDTLSLNITDNCYASNCYKQADVVHVRGRVQQIPLPPPPKSQTGFCCSLLVLLESHVYTISQLNCLVDLCRPTNCLVSVGQSVTCSTHGQSCLLYKVCIGQPVGSILASTFLHYFLHNIIK